MDLKIINQNAKKADADELVRVVLGSPILKVKASDKDALTFHLCQVCANLEKLRSKHQFFNLIGGVGLHGWQDV